MKSKIWVYYNFFFENESGDLERSLIATQDGEDDAWNKFRASHGDLRVRVIVASYDEVEILYQE